MAKQYRRVFHVPDVQPSAGDGGGWTVLWDTQARVLDDRWSTATAQTEAGALERAAHFMKLGFSVHAIRDPNGATFMDAAEIADRFRARAAPEPPDA